MEPSEFLHEHLDGLRDALSAILVQWGRSDSEPSTGEIDRILREGNFQTVLAWLRANMPPRITGELATRVQLARQRLAEFVARVGELRQLTARRPAQRRRRRRSSAKQPAAGSASAPTADSLVSRYVPETWGTWYERNSVLREMKTRHKKVERALRGAVVYVGLIADRIQTRQREKIATAGNWSEPAGIEVWMKRLGISAATMREKRRQGVLHVRRVGFYHWQVARTDPLYQRWEQSAAAKRGKDR